jgi:hypothetical protein
MDDPGMTADCLQADTLRSVLMEGITDQISRQQCRHQWGLRSEDFLCGNFLIAAAGSVSPRHTNAIAKSVQNRRNWFHTEFYTSVQK